jgi:uncharacterized protein (DUF1015 family)
MRILAFVLVTALLLVRAISSELPIEVVNAIANDSWGQKLNPSLTRQELGSYFTKNWRSIAANIEALPLSKYDTVYKKKVPISSHSLFFESCEALEPVEYVEFVDGMVGLYEQKRISANGFELLLLPEGEKQSFLSVNYEDEKSPLFLRVTKNSGVVWSPWPAASWRTNI